MSLFVPDFETEDDCLLPASSNSKRHKKSTMADEDIMELLWQNGQLVMQSQNQRPGGGGNKKAETTSSREIRSSVMEDETTPCNLFMQEDEMVSWLHYPSEDNNLDLYLHNDDMMYPGLPSCSQVLNTSSSQQLPPRLPVAAVNAPPPRPVVPLKPVEEEQIPPKFSNFLHFSRVGNKGNLPGPGSAPLSSNKVSKELTQSTVVESNGRPEQSRASRLIDSCTPVSGTHKSSFGGASSVGGEPETYDLTGSSSPVTGGSGASASIEPLAQKPPAPPKEDRKRKGRDTEDTECYSEDAEFEYPEAKKQSRGSTSTKRSRAAEVHNLSERRRRDRINEKMKALQELIPRCNKSDKASMLDEAIEYLKSLQMQVQMMSMGYSMVPMMFPGVQRYMPAMAAMGMGMGMDQVGMNRPMVPYPPVLPGSTIMPNPAAAAHLTQRFPVSRFPMPQVPVMGPARSQAASPPDPMMNAFPMQNANQPRIPFTDPYQRYTGLPQTQMPVMPQPQNQTGVSAVISKPSSSKDVRGPEHHPTG